MASSTNGGNDKIGEIDFSKLDTLDKFFRLTQPTGSHRRAISNNLYGINHRAIKGIIPENRDSYGLVFFTRPALNLSNSNLRNNRKFYSLLTKNPNSIHRYVRVMLDPRITRGKGGYAFIPGDTQSLTGSAKKDLSSKDIKAVEAYQQVGKLPNITCPLVDDKLGFIPVLTNTIKDLSGWPDIALPTYTSKEGLKREQWAIGDGFVDIYDSFDISCTFRNFRDEPLILLFETWIRYIAMVFEGMMSPYIDYIIENEIDYNTRIYRLILDESKTYVKKIAATGAAFPINVPNGKFFDYSDSEKYNNSSKDININFKCMGAEYNDDILVHEFNQVSCIFNPDFNMLGKKGCPLVKIPYNLLDLFNNRGYPLINKETLELEWYVSKESKTYKEIVQAYKTIKI